MHLARKFLVAGLIAGAAALVAVFATPLGTGGSAGAAPTLTFASPVQVGTGGSEPGIVQSPDGNLFINAPDGLLANGTSPSFVFRSNAQGLSWTLTAPGARSNNPGGGDSQIAVDPSTGTLSMIDLWLGSSTASVSTNDANSWTSQPVGGHPVQDRPWIAAAGGGIVYEATHAVPAGIVVSKSTDSGLAYGPGVLAATAADQTGCVCPPGNVIAQGGGGLLGSTDKVGVIYATSTGGINFAHSSNGGTSWTNTSVQGPTNDTTNSAFPVVANAGGNHLYAVWLNETGTASVIAFSSSSDWGNTWSAPTTVVSSGTSVYPWVAANGSTVAISLYHTATASATPDSAPAGTQWFASALKSADGGSTWSPLTTADPTPAKTGPVCTGGTNCSSDRELGDFQTDILDSAGHVDITYVRVPSAGVEDIEFVQGT
ncbi:MAG TPA: sialidase family protein [Acidimicrobiales bacterium]|nr:sialidase family protein [Acidimicrobiales bacterium]